jgi:hypothetical protein
LIFASSFPASLSVLLGSGNGTFQPAKKIPFLAGGGIVSADFNRDGKLDLAIGDNNSAVDILLGNGDGTFQKASKVAVRGAPSSLALGLGDFNNDGILDLVAPTVTGNF